MSTTIPNTEPTAISAGLTVIWQKVFENYSYDDGYTVAKYTINGTGGTKTITGIYASSVWTFTLSAADNIFTAGKYILFGWVEKAAEKYQTYRGTLEISASLTTGVATDQRIALYQQLDNINKAITDYTVRPVESIAVNGKQYQRPTLNSLLRFRAVTEKLIRIETKKENIRNGKSLGGALLVNFSNQ